MLRNLSLLTLALLLSGSISAKTSPWTKLSSSQIADILGWTATPNSQTICQGYYKELPIFMPADSKTKETIVKADRAILRRKKPSELQGNVTVTQTGRQLTGDKAISYPNQHSQKPNKLKIYGNVHLREPGMLAVGNQADVYLHKKSATMHDVTFRYQITPHDRQTVFNRQHQQKVIYIKGKNFRGNAKQIRQVKPKLMQFNNVVLTTCDPYSKAWLLKMSSLTFDKMKGTGKAYNARLLLHGIPVFYSPYFSFPIDNRRRSGFLTPNLALFIHKNTVSGSIIGWPYYWNIAPNYDMIITPTHYSTRGWQLSSLFRYLTSHGYGKIYYSILPDDRKFSAFKNSAPATYPNNPYNDNAKNALAHTSSNRHQFMWQDKTQYNPYWLSNVNINYVGDDYYLQDFTNAPNFNNNLDSFLPTTLLIQNANLIYAGQHWSVNTELENFQTLHPLTLGQTYDQYARLPNIDINGAYPNELFGLNYNLNAQFTDFQHPLFENNFKTTLPSVTGLRYNAEPSIDVYEAKPWGYINPKITFDATAYQLKNPVIADGQKSNMNRALPIYDIDTGLYFDRNVQIGNTDYTQTLEPRLFYLNVPYVDQNNLPLFDTSLSSSLTYDQLFATNRFQGFDRIGDANQISLGLTSRFIKSSTGADILDFSVGQIIYFQDRRVQRNKTTVLPVTDTANVSPIVGQVNWQFKQYWNTTGNFAYDDINHWLQNANIAVSYRTDNKHILNGGYSFIKGETAASNLQQISLGSVWPLSLRWQFLGGINYNLESHFSQTYLYGLQYNSCCWAIRLLSSQRFIGQKADGDPNYDQEIYAQFVLTGLTSAGTSSPSSILAYVIPGYIDKFGQTSILSPAN